MDIWDTLVARVREKPDQREQILRECAATKVDILLAEKGITDATKEEKDMMIFMALPIMEVYLDYHLAERKQL